MRVVDILTEELVVPQLRSTTKTEVLRELAEHLAAHYPQIQVERLVTVLLDRERLGTTAIGEGIAIPHGKLAGLKGVVAVFGRSLPGIDCHSLDGAPTKLFFLLVAPEDSAGIHLKALARVSRLLKDKAFRERLLRSSSQAADLYRAICEEDAKL
ncbi:MAG TPA: PTS sugar transporter subunit IIA [Candidatus Binatia bacterium]|jgi:PTS system nitrogen regulatory IIA component|nr:PTS sugar transporter subunit IIA [Candidatus Binatia bacterium]